MQPVMLESIDCCLEACSHTLFHWKEVPVSLSPRDRFLQEHAFVTRRYFLGLGAAGIAALKLSPSGWTDHAATDALRRAILDLTTDSAHSGPRI